MGAVEAAFMVVGAGADFMEEAEVDLTGQAEADSTGEEACARAEVARAPAEVAVPEGGLFRHLLLASQDHALRLLLLCARGAASRRGLATTTPGPGAISRAGISALEIPHRRPLPSPTGSGIPLAAKLVSADLLAGSRQPGRQATVAASTS